MKSLRVSEKTRKFWTVDALLGISAVIATVIGIISYFFCWVWYLNNSAVIHFERT